MSRELFSKTNCFVFKATLSADPILYASDYIFVVIYEVYCRLAFIRPGKDTTWTYVIPSLLKEARTKAIWTPSLIIFQSEHNLPNLIIDQRWSLIEEVVLIGDKFYAVDRWRNLFSFDSSDQFKCNVESKTNDTEQTSEKKYLVALNEKEFLMVERCATWDDDSNCETVKFKVFKFSFVKCDWIETNNLGDVALFVGDNFSIYVVVLKYYECQPNYVYFMHDYYRIRMDFKH